MKNRERKLKEDAKQYGMEKLDVYNPASPTKEEEYDAYKERSPPVHAQNQETWHEVSYHDEFEDIRYHREENREPIRESKQYKSRSPPKSRSNHEYYNDSSRSYKDRSPKESRMSDRSRGKSRSRSRGRSPSRSTGRSRERQKPRGPRSGMRSDGYSDGYLPEPPRRKRTPIKVIRIHYILYEISNRNIMLLYPKRKLKTSLY